MSPNAWVDRDGGEMAYSQPCRPGRRAWSGGGDDPVLLKPRGDSRSELIHLGQSVGVPGRSTTTCDWSESQGLASLRTPTIRRTAVLEGAGSRWRVNLQQHRDSPILRLAQVSWGRCPAGGRHRKGWRCFATIIGTRPCCGRERPLIGASLINAGSAARSLFDEGRPGWSGKPGFRCLGVMPWLVNLPPRPPSICFERRRP